MQTFEVRIALEQRVTREAAVRGLADPVQRRSLISHARIGTRDVVRSVVKMTEAFWAAMLLMMPSASLCLPAAARRAA